MNRHGFINNQRINRLKIGDRVRLTDGVRYKIIDYSYGYDGEKMWVGRRGGNNLKLIHDGDWEKKYNEPKRKVD